MEFCCCWDRLLINYLFGTSPSERRKSAYFIKVFQCDFGKGFLANK